MSSTTKTMILAAVILVAAIAGVALAEDTDAESVQVTYHLGDATIPVTTAEDGTVVLYGPEDVAAFYTVPDGKAFVAWQTQEEGGTIYQFGATIAVSAATDLYPRLVDVAQEVTFIADGEEAVAAISDGKVTVPEIDTAKEGHTFDGWLYSGDGKIYSAEEIADLTVTAGETFTAQYSEIFKIAWIVDGVTIATGDTTDTKQPEAPVKEHYEFAGWKDADGVMLTDDYTITEDVTFTAVFEPVMLTVTFVAGESTVATVAVPYGEIVVMPALPEGYSAWDFDFSTPITESITIQAIAATPEEPSDTYTVQFEESEIDYGSRWDIYLKNSRGKGAHWFSLMNSFFMALFLTVRLDCDLFRHRPSPVSSCSEPYRATSSCTTPSYSLSPLSLTYQTEDERVETVEEGGWKLIHGDVFRPPEGSDVFASLVGVGVGTLALPHF